MGSFNIYIDLSLMLFTCVLNDKHQQLIIHMSPQCTTAYNQTLSEADNYAIECSQ